MYWNSAIEEMQNQLTMSDVCDTIERKKEKQSKNVCVKCQSDGELSVGRKAKACGICSASRCCTCKILRSIKDTCYAALRITAEEVFFYENFDTTI